MKSLGHTGSIFNQFLDQLFSNPLSLRSQSLPPEATRPKDLHYQKIIIVAHSSGAVVSRLALVQAYVKKSSWLLKTRLVLFAPAHCGTRVQALLMSALTSVPWTVGIMGVGEFFCQPLEELKPGSELLKQLLEKTDKAQEENSEESKRLLAERVIHGANDKIAQPLLFSKDPGFTSIPRKDHFSVCKPNQDYTLPINELLGML